MTEMKVTRQICNTTSKILQACRQNAIFLINTSKLIDVNGVNSDLNGTLRKCHEVKQDI